MSEFTVVSTFSGCGGSSLGYEMAGGKILLAVDNDKLAAETYRLNFPNTQIYEGNIKNLSVDDALALSGLKKRELDVLDGSPPCQGFSMSGKRRFDDEKNQLFKEYARLLRGFKPKAFVMENVSGLVKGKMKILFSEIFGELKRSGYKVRVRMLNAKRFGVPQSRNRVIFIGVRDDFDAVPTHPIGRQKPISVENALVGIIPDETPVFDDKYAKLWGKVSWGQVADSVIGKGYNSCRKLHPKRPANTLPKNQTGKDFATICHWAEPRAISVREAKVLFSFPDDFILVGNYSQKWGLLGNSVPPLFIKAIAEHIRNNILRRNSLTSSHQIPTFPSAWEPPKNTPRKS